MTQSALWKNNMCDAAISLQPRVTNYQNEIQRENDEIARQHEIDDLRSDVESLKKKKNKSRTYFDYNKGTYCYEDRFSKRCY